MSRCSPYFVHFTKTEQTKVIVIPTLFFFVLWRIIGKVHLSVCPILLIRGSPQETVGWVCTNKKMLNKLIWSHPGSVSCLAAGRHSFDHPLSFPIC